MTIPNCELKSYNGAPTIFVDGEPICSTAYFCTAPTVERISRMAHAGVNIITWGLGGAAAHCSDIGWKGPDQYDFSHLDEAAEFILEHHPNAWLIPRIAVTAPKWWLEAHPEHNAMMSTGLAKGNGTGVGKIWCDDPRETVVSQASDLWQQGSEQALKNMIEHIDQSSWGHRCIGIQPNGGVNEWFVTHGNDWADYGPLCLSVYRKWLAEEKGITDAESWEIPRPEALQQGSWGGWHDPAVDTSCQLWWEFFHGLNARRFIETCSAIKDASKSRLITGGFYGYIGDSYANGSPAAWLYGHHHDLRSVTEHPAIDYLAAPYSYNNRQPGGSPESQIPTASCDLAGCFSFTENDVGTFWSLHNDSPEAVAKSTGMMIRDQGQRIIRRQGFWWMDLLVGDDWYDHDIIEKLITQLTSLQTAEARKPTSQYKAEIAVVLGNDTVFHAKAGHQMLPELVSFPLRHVMPAIGAPFDALVLPDLEREDLPPYKLFIFLDIPCVTATQRETMHRVLAERQATAYFHGVPGMIDGTCLDAASASATTGIELKFLGGKAQSGVGRRLTARFDNFDHPLVQGVPPSHTMGGYPADAIMFVADQDADIIARQSLKGRPAVAVKEQQAGWTSVFSSFAGAPPMFFRNLALQVGVHVFTDQDAVVDACDNLLLVHQIGAGPVRVKLHQAWTQAVDQITGETYQADDGHLTLAGRHGSTFLLGEMV